MDTPLYTYVTIHNIDSLNPDRLFVAFMLAIDSLLYMDTGDYADGFHYYHEWVAEHCWDRMHEMYKQHILLAVPNIEQFAYDGSLQINQLAFDEVYRNVFNRIVHFEKAEIIKRAQTKMLKEELAMKVMHPDRIERLIEQYGMSVIESY